MDSRKLLCCSLEIGVLVLGILSFISGLLFFITDILTIANWEKVEHNAAMKVLLGEASLTTVEFVYTIFGLIDILGSALLIAGIVMHKYFDITGISKYFLLPWTVQTSVTLLLVCLDWWQVVLHAVCTVATIGIVIYFILSVLALYDKFREEELANTGVQMAHINEVTTIPLPPYTIMRSDSNNKI